MEQKASLVWLDAGLGFKPVLKQRQGHGQGSSSARIPQTSEAMCSQRSIGRERATKAAKTTHKMKSACRQRTKTASAE